MISILIRNKNEAASLENAIKSIHLQNFEFPFEIVVIDDNSSDNSVKIAEANGCKVIPLDKKFTYGYALNFGILQCQYEIILLLSSHNILLSNDFPNKLISYFEDKNVTAVRCTPISNKNQILQSINNVLKITNSNYNHKKDWQNLIIANCSAIRKSVAVTIKFNEEIRSNEEKLWCLDVLNSGYTIISNVPCYFIYNKNNNNSAVIRDYISKFQIDGIPAISLFKYIFTFFKSIPWAIKIAAVTWYENNSLNFKFLLIPFKFKKGEYK